MQRIGSWFRGSRLLFSLAALTTVLVGCSEPSSPMLEGDGVPITGRIGISGPSVAYRIPTQEEIDRFLSRPQFASLQTTDGPTTAFENLVRYPAETREFQVMAGDTSYFRDVYVGGSAMLVATADTQRWTSRITLPDGSFRDQAVITFYREFNGESNCFLSNGFPPFKVCGTEALEVTWYQSAQCGQTGGWKMDFMQDSVIYHTENFKVLPQIEKSRVVPINQNDYPERYDHLCKDASGALVNCYPSSGTAPTPVSVGLKGCAITSATIVLNYHQATTTVTGVNSFLTTHTDSTKHTGGFIGRGATQWDSVATYGTSLLTGGIAYDAINYSDTSRAVLRSLICKYGPQVIAVKNTSHFVVAYGVTDGSNSVLVADPAGGIYTRLDSNDVHRPYNNQFNGIRRLVGPQYAATLQDGTILATFHSPGEIYLTDPSGRRVGIDPLSGSTYNELTGGFQGTEGLGDDDPDGTTHPDTNPVKFAGIHAPVAGTYIVTVTGTGTGTYQLDVALRTQDRQNGTSLGATDIPITPGEVHTYRFDYDPVSGSSASDFGGGFLGGGQNALVNTLLSYAAPGQKVTTVAPGTATFPLRIFYAPGVTPASFTATMNSTSIASLFHPVPGTSEVVHVPLSAGKNTLKLSIQGTAGSHSGTDQDALIFNN